MKDIFFNILMIFYSTSMLPIVIYEFGFPDGLIILCILVCFGYLVKAIIDALCMVIRKYWRL